MEINIRAVTLKAKECDPVSGNPVWANSPVTTFEAPEAPAIDPDVVPPPDTDD